MSLNVPMAVFLATVDTPPKGVGYVGEIVEALNGADV